MFDVCPFEAATSEENEVVLTEAIMALDFFATLFARVVIRWAAMPPQVLGAVSGIVQSALGLHVILSSLNAAAVITYHSH